MKISLIFTILCFVISLSYSVGQTSNDLRLKKGIFRNFEEFKNNSPTVEFDYSIVPFTI